jgi:hypothetical protein
MIHGSKVETMFKQMEPLCDFSRKTEVIGMISSSRTQLRSHAAVQTHVMNRTTHPAFRRQPWKNSSITSSMKK